MKRTFAMIGGMVLLAAGLAAAGTTYYVNATTGNDAAVGTSGAPWKTIQKAANTMVAGDAVVVAAGTYPERVTVSRSGLSGAPITFTGTGTPDTRGFTIYGNYITVRGFKVTGQEASWAAPAHGIYVEGDYAVIEDNYAYYSTRGGIHLRPSSANGIVRNNRAYRNGMVGIEIHGSNHLVEGNEVWGSVVYHTPSGINNGDADGFRFFGTGHIFRSNYVHDINFTDSENAGYAPHIDAFQTWTDTSHTAGTHILFERNLVSLPYYLVGGGGPHGSGFTLHNCSYIMIRNNIIYSHGGTQTYGDITASAGYSHHIVIENNTFVGRLDFVKTNTPVGITLQNCADSSVENNIVIDQVLHAIYVDTASLSGLSRSNNLCYNSDGTTPYGQVHYPTELWGVDPQFVNAAARDYHLKAGSPAINAGMTEPDIVDDYDGVARPAGGAYDIGAFEYSSGGEAPSIVLQPQSLMVVSGQPASLSVSASGTAPLTYQWYRGASGAATDPVAGATTSGYTTPGLLQSASYWVRITNAYGSVDSATAVLTVTAAATLPTVVTAPVSSITSTDGTTGGTVSADGGASVTARGVCWGTAANPSISGSHTSDGSGMGGFTSVLSGLAPSTTYHVRAYATNLVGTAYGTDAAFTTTSAVTLPTVTTSIVSAITTTGAAAGGTVSADGGAVVTTRGVCWGAEPNPTLANSRTVDGSGTGSFTSVLSGLVKETTYHVRAYATNASGTAYGADVTFTTPALQVPSVPFFEAFSGATLPDGWTTRAEGQGAVDTWTISQTALAGGYPNEVHLSWQEVASGTIRLVTPAIDTTGRSILYMGFKHRLATHGAGGVTLKVQTSPDGTAWTDEAWSILTTGVDIGPESVHTTVVRNLNIATTYVALTLTGSLRDFDGWDIDDVSLQATPPGPLKAPVLGSPRNGATKQPTVLKVSWKDANSSPDESGYQVRIKPVGGEYAYYDTVRDARSFLVSGLSTGTTYLWNVRALGDDIGTLDSDWADSGVDRQFTTGMKTTLLATTLTSPASGAGQASGTDKSDKNVVLVPTTSPVLEWLDTNSDPQEVRYEVRIRAAGGKYILRSAGPNSVMYLAAGLKKNTTYYWNVRAKGDRKTTLDSAWAGSGKDGAFRTGN